MNMRMEAKEKVEHVLFVLDESSSMEKIKNVTIDGINEQIDELRKTSAIKTYVSLVKFSSNVKILYWDKPLEEVEKLTNETYQPNGMTAMLDAVGQSVYKLRNDTVLGEDDVSFLVVIVSDGDENSSREYTWDSVRELITKCKEDKAWTITYMGANQDLSQVQKSMNIDLGNIQQWYTTTNGTSNAYINTTRGLENYRSIRLASASIQGLAASGVMSSFYSSVGVTTPTNSIDPNIPTQ